MNPTELFGRIVFWLIVVRLSLKFLILPVLRSIFHARPVWQTDGGSSFAVITGGTDGIGLAYCKYLASRGYKLLIIARNPQKLEDVRKQLQCTIVDCPEIQTLSFDFSTSNINDYDVVERTLAELSGRVDVLVNNVGVSFRTCEYFSIISNRNSQLLRQMISVNAVSTVKMTFLVLPQMIESNRGIIINVGSQSSVSPVPLLTLYSATKGFVDHFSRSIMNETRQNAPGIIVHTVLPGFVATNMSHLRPSWKVPAPDVYVRSAMNKIGKEDRTFGYWYHSLEGVFYSLTEFMFGEHFNCWLAFTILSGLRRKYYRAKRLPLHPFFD